MTAHCGRNPIFVHLKFLNNTNFDFKNRAKIEKDWFQIEWMDKKWGLPQCATLKKFADALGALSALSLSDFFCFLTSSIFSLISSPFLFLLHDFTIYFCRNASSSIPVANYVMTSKLSFFFRVLAETVPAMKAVPASRRWNRCPQDAEIPPPALIPAELRTPIRIPIPASRLLPWPPFIPYMSIGRW